MNKKLFKEGIGYGVGAVGLDLSYGMFYSYLSFYLTDALGVSPWFLLILAPIARLWDGINDPMMGSLVDRANSKMGKYRPWIIRGALLNAVVVCLLFNNPIGDPNSVKMMIYVAAFYILWGMTNTLADIPYWSMIPSMASGEKDRNLISTVARAFSGIGQGIISILTPVLIPILGGAALADRGSDLQALPPEVLKSGFGKWAIITAVFLVLFAIICVVTTKERHVVTSNEEKFSFKNALSMIKNNDQLLIFMLFAMISNAGFYMISGISIYYFNAVLEAPTLQSTFNLMGTVGSVLGLLVVPVASKFMNNRSIYKMSLLMAAGGYIGMAVVGYCFGGNVYGLGGFYILTSLGTASMFINQTVMLADIVDYGEFKLGKRNQSLTFSMKGFLQKMAYTMQSIIMYAAFVITKYQGAADATVQASASAKSAISFLMFIVPPAMMLLSLAIFSSKYKIYGEFKDKIFKTLEAKRVEK